jgi:hypothetical protein
LKPAYHLVDRQSLRSINYETSLEDTSLVPEYYYSYSYKYTWINTNENVIMHYSLKERDSLTLLDNQLQIKKEEKVHVFDLSEIRNINVEFKYLIIPLIVGGIVLSLSLLGIFSAVVEQWAGMVLVTIGIILLYLGIKGTYQVSVKTISHTFSFFLEENDNDLKAFINRLNYFRINRVFK